MQWAVGVTTVVERICVLLPRTLESLRRGGFTSPRLFVDGCDDVNRYKHFGLELTVRIDRIRAWGNWWLALQELYIRHPEADRYFLAQDDIICCRNLRQYLETVPYPESCYQNLTLYPANADSRKRGWYRAPSGDRIKWRGLGAQALVFDRTAVLTLLGKEFMPLTMKPNRPDIRYHRIDGAVVSKLETFNIMEYVHNPSLVCHIGDESIIGNGRQPPTAAFVGEDFDALQLLKN